MILVSRGGVGPVFVALTASGLETARHAAAAVGGEVHALASAVRCDQPSPLRRRCPWLQRADEEVDDRASKFPDSSSRLRQVEAPSRGEGWRASSLVPSHFHRHGYPRRNSSPRTAHCRHLRRRHPDPHPRAAASDKREEPPVIAISDNGSSVVPLLGGIAERTTGAANRRGARRLRRSPPPATPASAAPTRRRRADVANPEDAKPVMAALLTDVGAARWARWLKEAHSVAPDGTIRLVATTRDIAGDATTLVYRPRRLALGIGCERNAEPGRRSRWFDAPWRRPDWQPRRSRSSRRSTSRPTRRPCSMPPKRSACRHASSPRPNSKRRRRG
jgi:hypothetical protein